MTEKEKMLAGELYHAGDPELVSDRRRAQALMDAYNAATLADAAEQRRILADLFAACAEDAVVRAPVFVDYGYNVTLGAGVFLNYNCVLLDVCPIRIGDGAQIGPAVQVYAADHPRDPEARAAGLENGRPVTIGRNVWVGGGAIILPGVTVGDDAIIGAAAVVTRDVPAGATVAGNPATRVR